MTALGKGITNKQAKYLAALLREAGERWNHNGITRLQASREIDRLRAQLGVGPSTSPHSEPRAHSDPVPHATDSARSDAAVKRAERATPVGG